MCAQRNFRTSYYNSLGFHGVDVKISLETIMNEEIIDVMKLQRFSLKFGLPALHRIIVWKIILKILPVHPNAWAFVESQRREMYFNLKSSLLIMLGKFSGNAVGSWHSSTVFIGNNQSNDLPEMASLEMSQEKTNNPGQSGERNQTAAGFGL